MKADYFFSGFETRFEKCLVDIGGYVNSVGIRAGGEARESVWYSIRFILRMSAPVDGKRGSLDALHSLVGYSGGFPGS